MPSARRVDDVVFVVITVVVIVIIVVFIVIEVVVVVLDAAALWWWGKESFKHAGLGNADGGGRRCPSRHCPRRHISFVRDEPDTRIKYHLMKTFEFNFRLLEQQI